MKKSSRILALTFTIVLAVSLVYLPVVAYEETIGVYGEDDPTAYLEPGYPVDGEYIAHRQDENSAENAENNPGSGNDNPNYGTQNYPQVQAQGTMLEVDVTNTPATQAEQQIPQLETAAPENEEDYNYQQNQPNYEEVNPIHEDLFVGPDTPFVPAPHTGRASSMTAAIVAGILLLGGVLVVAWSKKLVK